jgi:hypothetical protein
MNNPLQQIAGTGLEYLLQGIAIAGIHLHNVTLSDNLEEAFSNGTPEHTLLTCDAKNGGRTLIRIPHQGGRLEVQFPQKGTPQNGYTEAWDYTTDLGDIQRLIQDWSLVILRNQFDMEKTEWILTGRDPLSETLKLRNIKTGATGKISKPSKGEWVLAATANNKPIHLPTEEYHRIQKA